jgi:hypothetical protein
MKEKEMTYLWPKRRIWHHTAVLAKAFDDGPPNSTRTGDVYCS